MVARSESKKVLRELNLRYRIVIKISQGILLIRYG